MSFTINARNWSPDSAETHAADIINTINELLQENDIKDANGEVVQLAINPANALYLLSLGLGERLADNDTKIEAAKNSFNIELCDDTQIENLLPIAAMTRNPGSYSTLRLTVKASEDGDCTIPAGTRAKYNDVYFVVNTTAVISAGSTQIIGTTCDTIGAIAVLTGEVTSFETSIANLESVENMESSIPGAEAETTNQLRRRLIQGDTIKYTVDGCKGALEALTGIAYARVYMNYNTTEPITLPGGVVLQPRHAYIVVHGASDEIASVYATYLSAPTQNAPGATTTAHTQNWVTSSGQVVPVYYDDATEKEVYVKVFLSEDSAAGEEVENQILRDLIVSSASWKIGEDVTSLLTSSPFINCTYAKIAYTKVSEDGETWTDLITTGCNVIARVSDATIEVSQL